MDNFTTILAIIIGWMLKEISSIFQASSQDRKAIAKTIPTLLSVHSEMEDFVSIEKIIAQASFPNEDQKERSRQIAIKGIVKSPQEKNGSEFSNALITIAEHDPLLAIKFRKLNEQYENYKKENFENMSSSSPEIYEFVTDIGRSAIGTFLNKFESNTTCFSLRHSIFLWVRVKYYFINKRKIAQASEAPLTEMYNELMKYANNN